MKTKIYLVAFEDHAIKKIKERYENYEIEFVSMWNSKDTANYLKEPRAQLSFISFTKFPEIEGRNLKMVSKKVIMGTEVKRFDNDVIVFPKHIDFFILDTFIIQEVITPQKKNDYNNAVQSLFEIKDVYEKYTTFSKSIVNLVRSYGLSPLILETIEKLSEQLIKDISILDVDLPLYFKKYPRSQDNYAFHHSFLASMISVSLGIKMGLNKEDILKVVKGLFLNDLSLTSNLLTYTHDCIPLEYNRLTTENRKTIDNHSFIIASILNSLKYDPKIISLVVAHHERKENDLLHSLMTLSREINQAFFYTGLTPEVLYNLISTKEIEYTKQPMLIKAMKEQLG